MKNNEIFDFDEDFEEDRIILQENLDSDFDFNKIINLNLSEKWNILKQNLNGDEARVNFE